ncbi:hypothetical protein PoB_002364200 [Plakobranchus ocellatus]|uniref:Uncharacterized protein n=1 Tax=Plakobranchus ocellatus TaxID=259542 RepID=A0AAV3ZR57_9GAST|nr:hypothetical protein PoB_002364200 [Plakobranchus ocellatus]
MQWDCARFFPTGLDPVSAKLSKHHSIFTADNKAISLVEDFSTKSLGFEPIDVAKKTRIEEVLEPDLDTAIVKLAKTRKQTPLRCIKEAREVANNNIYFYGKVCVVPEGERKMSITTDHLDLEDEENAEGIPTNLESFSKIITECIDERNELLKAQNLLNHNPSSSTNKKRLIVSPHFYSADFIIDKNV